MQPEKLKLSIRERVKLQAVDAGLYDRRVHRPCDPGRHGAFPGSAWADWYRQGYNLANQNEVKK